MLLEFSRLLLGVAIMFFHKPIADYIREHERTLVVLCRQRGLPVPEALGTEAMRTVYFLIGTFVVLFQMARIWMQVR